MTDWGSKFPGAVARIAAIFHIAKNYLSLHENNDDAVQAQAMSQAIKLAKLLEVHARKAFQLLSLDPNFENSRIVLKWIERNKQKKFTQRESVIRLFKVVFLKWISSRLF